ncbi:hypothetical protein [Oceanobacillus massiliensis]|uniref:hypothetical protein n=1 Tax=Oceanobacillus massiliensis TaxID=1465765 RepID=UPI0002F30E92|nr:hypothetical protein [Oceanobacillus massiliensis]
MPELFSIYDNFELEQDVMIIYHMISNYLIEENNRFNSLKLQFGEKAIKFFNNIQGGIK